jgi:hypothetical protein
VKEELRMSLRREIVDMARSFLRKTINVEMASGRVTCNEGGLLSKQSRK